MYGHLPLVHVRMAPPLVVVARRILVSHLSNFTILWANQVPVDSSVHPCRNDLHCGWRHLRLVSGLRAHDADVL